MPYEKSFYCYLKNPPSNLVGVYFVFRNNPFNMIYPHEDNVDTLEELLTYKISISEAFIFWDNKETPIIEDKIELVELNAAVEYNKEKLINQYLMDNNLIQKDKYIKLGGSYNFDNEEGIYLPYTDNTYQGHIIEAVYFDEGERIVSPNTSLADLLKLSDRTKKIYLFTFKTQKHIEHITLPISSDPYTEMRNWKREHHFIDYPPLIKESYYQYEEDILKHTFETDTHIYHLSAPTGYYERLQKWKAQCYFKSGDERNSAQIRDKVDDDSKLYTNDPNNKIYSYHNSSFVYPQKDSNGIYYVGIGYQTLYIPFKSRNLIILGLDSNDDYVALYSPHWKDWEFYGYFDTTKPPPKPAGMP